LKQQDGLESFSCISQGAEETGTDAPLPGLKDLTLHVTDQLTANTTQFLTHYLTGLKHLQIFAPNEQTSAVCDGLLDYMCRLDESHLISPFKNETGLLESFREAMQTFFSNTTAEKTLCFARTPLKKKNNWVMKVDSARTSKSIRLENCGYPRDVALIPTLDAVDKLVIEERHNADTKSTLMYLHQLQLWISGVPSVKKLVLSLPVDLDSSDDNFFHMVTDSPLSEKEKPSGIIGECIAGASGLRCLKLNYFSGMFSEGGFRIDLGKASLERLEIDVTPVRDTTEYMMRKKKIPLAEWYFILEVLINETGSRSMFKVTLDYLRITEIEQKDIRNEKRGKDYVRVIVSIAKLEYLDLHMYRKVISGLKFVDYLKESPEDIMHAKVSFL
jgi:hypothetical protein